MITTEDNKYCRKDMMHDTGYHALFNVSMDGELSAGVILVAVIRGVTYIFQLKEDTDILNEESISVMAGTLFETFEEDSCEEEIDYFPITNCRFPTEDELNWYTNLKTV